MHGHSLGNSVCRDLSGNLVHLEGIILDPEPPHIAVRDGKGPVHIDLEIQCQCASMNHIIVLHHSRKDRLDRFLIL